MSIITIYPFSTPSNYAYDSNKIEVIDGKAKLKNLETSTDFIEDFNDVSGLTFDTDLIEIVGSEKAALKLQNDIGLIFEEDFADDTGFTYDNTKAEFIGGKVQQKDQRPTDSIFYASFTNNEDASWTYGTPAGSLGGTANIHDGLLDLTGGNANLEWNKDNLATLGQTGCIRMNYKPNYTGSPSSTQYILQTSTNTRNRVYIVHNGSLLQCFIMDADGAMIFGMQFTFLPTSGQTYELEVNFDATVGITRFFVNGILKDSDTGTGTRNSTSSLFRIGQNSNCAYSMLDILIFNTVQHIANYTPGDVAPEYVYLASKVELPQMSYSGIGIIQSFTDFTTSESGSSKYVINDLYYDGTWKVSDGTYAQANTKVEILAAISSLPASDTVDIDIIFPDSNSQSDVDNLIITYTGQIYPISNPTIDIDTAITATAISNSVSDWNTFTEIIESIGSDVVKYVLSDDNGLTYKYWNGSSWTVSSGYAQSNTGTDINSNITSFPKTISGLKIKIYLHSNDGTTTPNINNLVVNYNDYIFATDNPSIIPLSGFTTEEIETFIVAETALGNNKIKYVLEIDGVNTYWNGTAWLESTSYTQSNTADEINNNLSSIPITTGITVKPIAYFHSENGSINIELNTITFAYDFYNPADTKPGVCIVTGRVLDSTATNYENIQLTVNAKYSTSPIIDTYFTFRKTILVSIVNGYFEVELIHSNLFAIPMTYEFSFKTSGGTEIKKYKDVIIPSTDTAVLNDLVDD